MILLTCIALLLIVAGISKACADSIQSQIDHSIFKGNPFFDPFLSWRNKWTNSEILGSVYQVSHWYYLGYRTKYKERFPFSSTILVGIDILM